MIATSIGVYLAIYGGVFVLGMILGAFTVAAFVHLQDRDLRSVQEYLQDREVELAGNPFLGIERPASPAWRWEA